MICLGRRRGKCLLPVVTLGLAWAWSGCSRPAAPAEIPVHTVSSPAQVPPSSPAIAKQSVESPSATPSQVGRDGPKDDRQPKQGASPTDANSAKHVMLARYRFNDDMFPGTRGQLPRDSAMVGKPASFDGFGAEFNQVGARLAYRLREADGQLNMNYQEGSVRFMFKPYWTSASIGGSGPGGEGAVLLQAGDRGQRGSWTLRIHPDGNTIELAQQNRDREDVLVGAALGLDANQWYLVALGYGPQGSELIVTGIDRTATRVAWNLGRGLADSSPFGTEPEAFWVGNDSSGRAPARGVMDELDTYNFAPPIFFWLGEYDSSIGARVETSPLRVRLEWRMWPECRMTVRRRAWGAEQWSVLATNYVAWHFVDGQVEKGARYEYSLEANEEDYRSVFKHPKNYPVESRFDRYLEVAVETPPTQERGSILLIVDETLFGQPDMNRALETTVSDLALEGWRVIPPVRGPRHDDAAWANNIPKIQEVTRLVRTAVQQFPDLSCIYLVGHVAFPLSGNQRPDGNHHTRPFPVDMYYGDTIRTDNDWTDTVAHYALPDARSRYRDLPPNSPGDGKFDASRYPSVIEIPVGRVDFARLEPFRKSQGADEMALTVRYLDKVHRFRTGQLQFGPSMSAFSSLPYSLARSLYRFESTTAAKHALECLRAWSSDPEATPQYTSVFKPLHAADVGNRYLLSRESGSGSYGGIGMNSPFQWTTSDVAAPGSQRVAALVLLYGSFLGEWQKAGSFMRALLAQPDSTLAVLWMMQKQDERSLQAMGCGRTIGEAWAGFLSNLNERDRDFFWASSQGYHGSVQYSLLGDPTLTLQRPAPPQSLVAMRNGAEVRLAWQDPGQGEQGYAVARSTTGVTGPYRSLNDGALIQGRSVVDANPPPGPITYRVRASRRYTTGSGTFDILSRGVIATVE